MDLATELIQFGPHRTDSFDVAEARAYCRRLARSHYENFTALSWLFPKHLHQPLANVYAYCRWADDLADEPVVGYEPRQLLAWWQGEIDRLYAGNGAPRHPVFAALAETVREFSLPREPFADLLVAFRRDQEQTRYETFADLLTYCEKSANPVGRIVLHLGRSHDEPNAKLSDAICTGLQLANFCQDVKRDFQRGRIYLQQDECRRAGWDEAHFAAGRFDPAFRNLLEPLAERAAECLAAGEPLVGRVHHDLRLPVRLFLAGGRAILAAIRQKGYDVWSQRPTVGRLTKLRLLASAFTNELLGRTP